MTNALPRRQTKDDYDYDDRDRWLDDQDGGDRWRRAAACRDSDPALFFPVDIKLIRPAVFKDDQLVSEPVYAEEEPPYPPPEVLEICDRCPVRGRCLNKYLDEDYGIYGGTTGFQRGLMTKKITRKVCMTCQSTDLVVNGNQKKEICLACGTSWDIL